MRDVLGGRASIRRSVAPVSAHQAGVGPSSGSATDDSSLLREGSLPAAWVDRWRSDPDAVVLIDEMNNELTAGEVEALTAARAAALFATGVGAGATVLLSCSASIDLVLTYAALMRLGATVLPANTGYTERELEYIVEDARPIAAIVDRPGHNVWLQRLGVELVLRPSLDLPEAPMSASALPEIDLGAPAFIAYTSGTTGAPKGAVLTHANLLAGAESVRRAWDWSPEDRLVLALPLFHMHGLGVGVNGTLLAGASAVVLDGFAVDRVLDAVSQHRATMFFGVPTMYSRLASSDRMRELAALRLAVSGSAPLPASVWHRIAKGSGQHVLERYGMTETVMLASNPLRGDRRPGTVGLPLPGVEIRLGDGEGVEVRGPNVFSEYLGRPEATAAAFTPDGWFRTGDVGAVDTDGYLRLAGRSSELIISGGFNVYPREVEDVLREHPLVREVAIVGTPDEEWGEIVTGYVVLEDAASAYSSWSSTLVAHCSERLAPYKLPRRWYRVSELPRNAMGKVVRSELSPP